MLQTARFGAMRSSFFLSIKSCSGGDSACDAHVDVLISLRAPRDLTFGLGLRLENEVSHRILNAKTRMYTDPKLIA